MMTLSLRAALFAGVFVLPVAATAQEIQKGPAQPLGDGAVLAFAETDAAGAVTRIGVEMTETAVASLGHDMVLVSVPLPEAARAAGYDHVALDWMPHGHAPEGLFDSPHFDVHFYMTSEAERLAIDPSDPLYMQKAGNRPDAALMPANYMPPPQVEPVPAMGEHWVDMTASIFSGQPFEAVLIYGAWDGAVTFVEPMVTRELLQSHRSVGGKVAQPERVAASVSLPGAWSVSHDPAAGLHVISIDGLVARSPDKPAVQAAASN